METYALDYDKQEHRDGFCVLIHKTVVRNLYSLFECKIFHVKSNYYIFLLNLYYKVGL